MPDKKKGDASAKAVDKAAQAKDEVQEVAEGTVEVALAEDPAVNMAVKELAGAVNDAEAYERAAHGDDSHVEDASAKLASAKDGVGSAPDPGSEQEALAKQEKEVAERLEAAAKKAEKDDESK